MSTKSLSQKDITMNQLIPNYMTPEFQQQQKAKLELQQLQAQINYKNYLRDLYELDERSPFTYIWNDMDKTYTKVLWRTIWEERERIQNEENEKKWEQTLHRIENMMMDKLEREKPWLFEDVHTEEDRKKLLRKYYE